MPKHFHCTHIIIADHAFVRLNERFGISNVNKKRLKKQIMGKLRNMLKIGVEPNSTFCIDVPLDQDKVAVCSPQANIGGWCVVTFERNKQIGGKFSD